MRRSLLLLLCWLLLSPGVWAGASRNFRGGDVDDMIDYGSDTDIDNFSTLTFAAWILQDAYVDVNGSRIVGKSNSVNTVNKESGACGTGGDCFQFFSTWSGADGDWYTSPDSNVIGVWQFVMVTYNTGATTNDPIIYKNCSAQTIVQEATPTGTVDADGAINLRTGNNASPGIREWDGQIAYVHYYSRILTAAECTDIMWNPGILPASLFEFSPQLGSDSPELDISGNANTGTVTGATESALGPATMFGHQMPL